MRNKCSAIAVIVFLLAAIAPTIAHTTPYQNLLKPDEVMMKVVYPQGHDPIAKKLAVVYYVPKDQADSVTPVRAFAVYNTGKKRVRLDLKEGQIWDDGYRVMCGDTSKFELPLSDADVTRLTPRAVPQLILSGTGFGSGGYTTISIFTLYPVRLSETRTPLLCAESQLEKECGEWASTQKSPTRTNRWTHAESIDDIKYVLRQVRGE